MSTIVEFKRVEKNANGDAIDLVEGLLERLRSGDAIAVGLVEVKADGCVATAYSVSKSYHFLCSGAASLAARLASD